MFIALTRHDQEMLFLTIEHITAWGLFPGGSAPTQVFLSSGQAFYVEETPEEICKTMLLITKGGK
jgi:hypothetical protein